MHVFGDDLESGRGLAADHGGLALRTGQHGA